MQGSTELNHLYSDSEKNFLLQYIEKEYPVLPLEEVILRLNQGEPIDYILGYTYFYGLKIRVNTSVLIPRPETEELVEWIIQENKQKENLKILDIGTGSGCIALALKENLLNSILTAIDLSENALEVARKNAIENNVLLDIQKLDILNEDEWPNLGQFDLIVSNPPYIRFNEKATMSPSVLDYEPHGALFVENDPLIFYKKILEFSQEHLHKDGLVYFETSQFQQLLDYDGFQIERRMDLSGNWRFLKAKKCLDV